mgnify:CR=1 FL=1
MTRAAASDLMQSFRFHVTANMDGSDPLQPGQDRPDDFGNTGDIAQAGFQSATLPELTVEPVEYREGTMMWTQKYPGPPTVSDVSLMRGAAKKDTAFYDWVLASVNGEEYRADVTIWHYHRTDMGSAAQNAENDDYKQIVCYNCFGMRAKPSGDLDSTSGEVSLLECDFSLERFEVLSPSAE